MRGAERGIALSSRGPSSRRLSLTGPLSAAHGHRPSAAPFYSPADNPLSYSSTTAAALRPAGIHHALSSFCRPRETRTLKLFDLGPDETAEPRRPAPAQPPKRGLSFEKVINCTVVTGEM
ncbi:hypothetical protein EVAR_14640_1 [Eumeta japonica]|uniref:Uncharacterized protein n=1 Tax=Eumeta variegata TaxID=151549 RepID=A0A4C1U255_EUMVA|nr:hypothetical protein EVAR_14640_1 [Eumeta japonica]